MKLLQMSLSAAVFIPVVAVIRAAYIDRLPKQAFPVLWYIILARLLLPVSLPVDLPEKVPLYRNVPVLGALQSGVPGLVPGAGAAVQAGVQTAQGQPPAAIPVVTLIWLAGAAVTAVCFLLPYLRCRWEFRTSLPVRNSYAQEWLKTHSLKRTVEIRSFAGISTPLTYGMLRPVILTPKNMDWENTRQAEYILFHEYAHIRRLDAVGKLAAAAAVCVHWFNPTVWLLYVLLNRDIELACDEYVVRHFGEDGRAEYAGTLIRMEERRSGLAPFQSYFAETAIEERICAIMKFKKKSVFAGIAALALAASLALVMAATAAPAQTPKIPDLTRNNTPSTSTVVPPVFDLDEDAPLGTVPPGGVENAQPPETVGPSGEAGNAEGTAQPATPAQPEIGADNSPAASPETTGVTDTDIPAELLSQLTADGEYPVNSHGHTYGSILLSDVVGHAPDLIAAVGMYGAVGYVWEKELRAAEAGGRNAWLTLYDVEENGIDLYQVADEIPQIHWEKLPPEEVELYFPDGLLEKLLSELNEDGTYPVNARGETYGPDGLGNIVGYEPDLIAATGVNGKDGYIPRAQVPAVNTLEDAAAYDEASNRLPCIIVPVYDLEGNVIDEFHYESGSLSQAEIDAALGR